MDAQVAAIAAAQHGVVALEQIVALGLTARSVQRRAATGRLHRVHHAVYSLAPPALLSAKGRYLAAVLACGGGWEPAARSRSRRSAAALSHRSAADLHGLRACHRRTVEVIVPGRCTRRHPGIQVHRCVTLTAKDITTVDGIPVTTVARTLLDLAAVVGRRTLERALDQAEVLRVFDLLALVDQTERNRTTLGAARLRAALDRHTAGATVTWSELEERFLGVCRAGRLPAPHLQPYVDPRDGGPPLRPDFVWWAPKVAVETDGRRTHLTATAFETDRLRDQRLLADGWRVMRVTWRQLTDDPHRITAAIARMLATR